MNLIQKMACAALVLAAGATANAAQPQYTITDLGNGFNPRFGAVFATSVNNRGEVSGWAYAGENVPMHHGFSWEHGTLTDLGVPANAYESAVYGLNNRGTYVGHSGNNVAYLMDGVWTRFDLPGGAQDVNDRNTIVGYYTNPGTRGFMLRNGVFTDIGSLGVDYTIPYAVNSKDAVVGFAYTPQFHPHAFLYQDGVTRDLGTLGGTDSYAYDINDHGVIVGAASVSLGHTEAFIYDGTMRQLPLPIAHANSMARSINDHGDIVGTIDGRGFLLTRDGTLTILEQLPQVASGQWRYLQPVAINDRGWIVGTGYRGESSRSFLITPK